MVYQLVLQEIKQNIEFCLDIIQMVIFHKHKQCMLLTRVWQQHEYRIDVCRVIRGAHIEHL